MRLKTTLTSMAQERGPAKPPPPILSALVCDNDLFHHPDDRWPHAVDVAALAKYARSFATALAQMAAA